MDSTLSDNLRRLFCTPSLIKGEDPDVYAELCARVEEVAQPQDVYDQMIATDMTNHFWEQQRYRRCTGTVINTKRRAALERILHGAIHSTTSIPKLSRIRISKSHGSRTGR
jgi:hypothetical protein